MKTPVNLRMFTIAMAVATIHFVTGLTLLLGNVVPALYTTPMYMISVLCGFNPTIVATLLVSTAIAAMVPFFQKSTVTRRKLMFFVIPQQLLLLLHFVAVGTALYTGHYPDGYVPKGGTYFIFIDQIWILTIIFWHTMEYVVTMGRGYEQIQ